MTNFIVTTLLDENDTGATVASSGGTGLSLREAVALANANADADTITFDAALAGGTINLSSQISLSNAITIDGDTNGDDVADITIDASATSRAFTNFSAVRSVDFDQTLDALDIVGGNSNGAVSLGSAGNITITNSTIRDSGDNAITISGADLLTLDNTTIANNGGGLRATTALTGATINILNSTFSNNTESSTGGAIYTGANTLNVNNSTFAGNTANADGGAIFIAGQAPASSITNSTFYQNTGGTYGGAVHISGGANHVINNSTFVDNTQANNFGSGGGLSVGFGTTAVTIQNSVFARNTSVGNNTGEDLTTRTGTTLSNVFSETTIVGTYAGTNVTNNGGDAGLGGLADNGGVVQTIAIAQGSALIGAGDAGLLPADTFDLDNDGNSSEPLTLDANGQNRILDGTLDIGAVEFNPPFLFEAPLDDGSQTVSLAENSLAGIGVIDVDANDGMGGATDAGITYSIISGNTDVDGDMNGAFAINAATGEITVNDTDDFDFENPINTFTLIVQGDNGGSVANTLTTTVNVNVTDVVSLVDFEGGLSDGTEEITIVDSSVALNGVIFDVGATDGIGGTSDANISYSIVSGNVDTDNDSNLVFSIDSTTGVITLNDSDDFLFNNVATTFTLLIEADAGITSNDSNFATLVINLDDDPETFTVTTADDIVDANDGLLSLREAVTLSNVDQAADTIVFDVALAGSTIELNSTLALTNSFTLDGDVNGDDVADITVSANSNARAFQIGFNGNAVQDASLTSLNIIGGTSQAISTFSSGTFTITDSSITGSDGYGVRFTQVNDVTIDNSVISDNGNSAVSLRDVTGGNVVISNTTIDNNIGTNGALFIDDNSVALINSTVSNNTATSNRGGAVFVEGANANINAINTTFYGNSSDISGGAIFFNSGGLLDLSSTTFVENNLTGSNSYISRGGAIQVYGNNVSAATNVNIINSAFSRNVNGLGTIGDDIDISNGSTNTLSSVFTETTIAGSFTRNNVTDGGGDAGLGGLNNNGGLVQTVAISQGSALIGTGDAVLLPLDTRDIDDNGNATEVLPLDANGNARILDGALDIGAVEFNPALLFEAPLDDGVETVTLAENSANNTSVFDVDANDNMGGASDAGISYSIISGNIDVDNDGNDAFAIDAASGQITINDADDLDFENPTNNFALFVQGDTGAADNNTASALVNINLTDVISTIGFEGPLSDGSETITVVDDLAVNDAVFDVDANDGLGGASDANIIYSIVSGNTDVDMDGNDAFAFDSATGEITLNDADDFVFENAINTFSLTIEADGGVAVGDTAFATLNINLDDEPQTLTVTTADDVVDAGDGLLSLREALNIAELDEALDTIQFDAALIGSTINLTSILDISEDLIIDGDVNGDNVADITISGDGLGDDATIIDGQGNTITDVANNSNTVDNSGGFIVRAADLTLNGLVLTGAANDTTGGIGLGSNASLTGTNLSISGNTDLGGGGIDVFGSNVTIELTDSLVSHNAATSGSGGGISGLSSTILTLTNTDVLNNTSTNAGAGISAGGTSVVTIVDSTIGENSTTYRGGGISNSGATFNLTNVTISGNSADDSGGGINGTGDFNLTNVSVVGNSSGTFGGGIRLSGSSDTLTITQSTITGNQATTSGGGISSSSMSDDISIQNSILLGNNAGAYSEIGANNGATSFTEIGSNIIGVEDAALADVFAAVGANADTGVSSGLLSDNGGPVQTVALNADVTNPALDAATQPTGVTTDARGQTRSSDFETIDNGGIADLGAFELINGVADPLVVTTSADTVDAFDGLVSLREAIEFANSDGVASTITFASGIGEAFENNATIRLTNGELEITAAVIIDGSTAGGNVVITGDANDNDVTDPGSDITNLALNTAGQLTDNTRVFNIDSSSDGTVLTGLTITGGVAPIDSAMMGDVDENGGGILTDASLTLNDILISGNQTTAPNGSGGGIQAVGSATLTLNNSVVTNNQTLGNFANGGGINTAGSLVINGSEISNNSVIGGSSVGAGIYSGNAVITNSTIGNNTAGGIGGNGGAIFSAGTTSIVNSTISGNSVAGNYVGGIYSNGALGVTNSIILGNVSALGTDNELAVAGGGTPTFTGSNIVGADATAFDASGFANAINADPVLVFFDTSTTGIDSDGDGIAETSSSVIGGQLNANGSSLVSTIALADTFLNPALDAGAAPAGVTVDAAGQTRSVDLAFLDNGGTTDLGAFELQTLSNQAPVGTNLPTDVTVTQNTVSNIDLSALTISDLENNELTVTLTVDAGTFNAPTADANVVATLVSSTTITLVGTAVFLNSYLDDATNIQYTPVANTVGDNAASITATVSDGFAAPVALGMVNIDVAEQDSFVVTTTADVIDGFDGETSLREAIAFANSNADANIITFANGAGDAFNGGGVIRLTQGELVISEDLTIEGDVNADGQADITVSGDALGDDATVTDSNGTIITDVFTNTNTADNSAVFNIAGGDVNFNGLTITGGVDFDGAGIYVLDQTSLTFTNGSISGNSSQARFGAGVFNGGTTTITDSIVSLNMTDGAGRGGALFNLGNDELTLTNVTVSGNHAENDGGAIANAGGTLTIDGSTFEGNTAGDNGGAIANEIGGTATITNSTFSNNEADGSGGAFYAGGGSTATLTNTTIHGNRANGVGGIDGGGGITALGNVTATNTTITGNTALNPSGGVLAFVGTVTLNNSIVVGNSQDTAIGSTGSINNNNGTSLIGGDATTIFASVVGTTGVDGVAGNADDGIAGALADNGGNVETVALLGGAANPAINTGDAVAGLLTDARGAARVQGGQIDLGAFEAQSATAGDDLIIGTAGIDNLDGLAGDDTIEGGAGSDVINGGANGLSGDTASYESSSEFVIVNLNGNPNFGGDAFGDQLISIENLTGSQFGDILEGNFEDNIILGLNGADSLTGFGGNDRIEGGDGDDVIQGVVGNNTLFGDGGADQVFGGTGMDTIFGGIGGDSLFGADGDDIINGDEGNDALVGGTGNDTLNGGEGVDFLSGEDDNDTLNGGADADQLFGGLGIDTLNGGSGDDLLNGGLGADILDGGAGNDTADYFDSGELIIVDLFGAANFGGTAAGDQFISIENITGSNFGDIINGNQDNNVIIGGGGADSIVGFGGDDTIDGGEGADVIQGVSGNNVLMGGSGGDQIFGGVDQDVINGGVDADTLFGVDGDDVINGGLGGDALNGGLGDDVLNGDEGADSIFGAEGDDTIDGGDDGDTAFGGAGNDTLAGGLGDDALVGEDGDDTINGNEGLDFLSGGIGMDSLDGGADADLISGGNDDDILSGGTGQDSLFGDGGSDTLNGGEGVDVLFGEDNDDSDDIAPAGNDTLNGGEGGDLLFGGAGNDTLNGDNGDDVLRGESGNDTLSGGMGIDFLIGGDDMDTFVFSAGDDADTVLDYQNDIDQLDLSSFNFNSVNDALDMAIEDAGAVFFNFGNGDTLLVSAATEAELSDDIII